MDTEQSLKLLAEQIAAAHALASEIMVDHHNEPRHLRLLNMLFDAQNRVDALTPSRSKDTRRAT
jgi:hypothetical protein